MAAAGGAGVEAADLFLSLQKGLGTNFSGVGESACGVGKNISLKSLIKVWILWIWASIKS